MRLHLRPADICGTRCIGPPACAVWAVTRELVAPGVSDTGVADGDKRRLECDEHHVTQCLSFTGRAHRSRPKYPGPGRRPMTNGTLRQPRRIAVDTAPPEVGLNPGHRAGLHELSDNALLAQVRAQPRDSELRAAACEILVDRYTKLVRACVRQYRGSPEPTEDLIQVGYVGLLKAINNYDPEVGDSLAAYAQPCVYGEIKRHFRDKRWQIHVRRSAQELLLELRKASEELTHQLGRAPEQAELADRLGVGADDMQEARQADLVFSTYSLATPPSGPEGPAPRDDPA